MSEVVENIERTLEWLVRNSDASVRLSNCVIANPRVSVMTIRELLSDKERTRRTLLTFKNLGAKTINELFALADKFVADRNIDDREPAEVSEQSERRARASSKLLSLLSRIPFPNEIFHYQISIRLEKLLKNFREAQHISGQWEAKVLNVGHVVADWPNVCLRLLGKANCGRKTIAELESVIVEIVKGGLSNLGVANDALSISSINELTEKALDPSIAQMIVDPTDVSVSMPAPNSPILHQANIPPAVSSTRGNSKGESQRRAHGHSSSFQDAMVTVRAAKPEILTFLRQILDARDFDVLTRRYGVFIPHPETLEEISVGYRVTRERIRQIEKRALRRCAVSNAKRVLQAYLANEETTIISTLVGPARCILAPDALTRETALDPLHRLCIDVCYGSYREWLGAHLTPVRENREIVGWLVRNQPDESQLREKLLNAIPASSSLRRRIIAALAFSPWPVHVRQLTELLPGVPIARVEHCLREEFGATLENGLITAIRDLPATARLLIVLRAAGGAISLKEVRAKHLRLFGSDIEEQAASAVLGRLKEALIVNRGTYCLYAQLPFDGKVIGKIRSIIYAHVKNADYYVSAKVLYRAVIDRMPPDACPGLTDYMILGFCQDDPRFSIRPGLMIGLATPEFESRFVSLNDTVHKVMKKYAPLRIAEIKKHMSNSREVADTSIWFILKESPEFVLAAPGLFDLISRVVGDKSAISRLSDAIEIALVDGAASARVLITRLHSIGVKYELPTLISYLAKLSNVTSSDGVFRLEKPSDDVEGYNRHFHRLYDTQKIIPVLRERLSEHLADDAKIRLLQLDYRLAMEASEWDHAEAISNKSASFLRELLREFEFS